MATLKKYKVTMVEKVFKTIEVEATSKKAAIEEAENASDEEFEFEGDYWSPPQVFDVEVLK